MTWRLALVLTISFFGHVVLLAWSAELTPKPVTSPVDVVIPNPPTAFAADGKFHLVYELHIANLGAESHAVRVRHQMEIPSERSRSFLGHV